MRKAYRTIGIGLLLLTACEANNKNVWENIDYAKIAQENYRQENDVNYTPPTVIGCVDDDLYNCPVKSVYH